MDGKASVCHQQDILSRHLMIYLLSRSWSLLHMSLAMTPEHAETSVENSARRSDKAEHSRSMCLSSPKARCGKACKFGYGKADASGGLVQSAANEPPCEISISFEAWQCPWGHPNSLGKPDARAEKTSGDMYTISHPDQSMNGGPRAKSQDQTAAATQRAVPAPSIAP